MANLILRQRLLSNSAWLAQSTTPLHLAASSCAQGMVTVIALLYQSTYLIRSLSPRAKRDVSPFRSSPLRNVTSPVAMPGSSPFAAHNTGAGSPRPAAIMLTNLDVSMLMLCDSLLTLSQCRKRPWRGEHPERDPHPQSRHSH